MTDHYLYILTTHDCGPIFIDSTSDLKMRLKSHKSGHLSQAAFRIDRLVHAERFDSAAKADKRAAALRAASREWVNALIERRNPCWIDLAERAKDRSKFAA